MAAQHHVVWFEIYVDDMARAQAFYQEVFQCKLSEMPAPGDEPIQMMAFPGDMEAKAAASGALVKMEGFSAGGSGTIVYFYSEDCREEGARIPAAGGKVLRPKTSLGEHGFMVLAQDSEGNTFGVHSMG
ncbi:MAG: VOC family protein [Lewinella sp.]